MTHTHTSMYEDERPFFGPVAEPDAQNPAAHGGVRIVEHCECGAIREMLVNFVHEEQGDWYQPEDDS